MNAVKNLLLHPIVPNLSSAQCAQYSLIASGIILMVGGVLKLSSLGLSENGLLLAIVMLIVLMLLCVVTGCRWNRDGARLRYTPTVGKHELVHPYWDKIFDHLGSGLDIAVTCDRWCQQNGVVTGAGYLRLWVAKLLQHPTHSLPYLFFYSPEQNCGKSAGGRCNRCVELLARTAGGVSHNAVKHSLEGRRPTIQARSASE